MNQRQCDDYKSHYGKYSYPPKETNPYGKKLTCADCGSVLKLYRALANDGTQAYYGYICPAYEEKGEMACTKKSVRSMVVNEAVLVALRIQIRLFPDASKVLSTLMENERRIRERETPEKKIRSPRRKLERKRILSSTLYSDWKSGLLTLDEYLFGKRKYAQDMEDLNRRIMATEKRKQASEEKISDIERWTQQIAQHRNAAEVTYVGARTNHARESRHIRDANQRRVPESEWIVTENAQFFQIPPAQILHIYPVLAES